ncbi:MAG: hypothetical protein AMXMBFR50_24530 [Ignavibacterium album]
MKSRTAYGILQSYVPRVQNGYVRYAFAFYDSWFYQKLCRYVLNDAFLSDYGAPYVHYGDDYVCDPDS